jgi:acetylornithine/succinyldiaminopimelate/putrescine aminotransferase
MANKPLLVEQLTNDPRVAEAKKLLQSALEDCQSKISAVSPPQESLRESYEQMVQEFAQVRGNKLFFPYIGSGFGKGPLVELLDGSVKFDFITGIGPHCFGHSSPLLLESNIDAALSDLVMQGNLQQNKDALDFCKLLTSASGFDHCFLSTTGVMANENALKIAFQKHYPANRILAFEHCFLGRSLATSQVTDKPAYREGLPINYQIDYIPFFDETKPEESLKNSIDELKKTIKRHPKKHAVMILELVQGEGGFYTGTREFFGSIIQVLKDNNIAVFIDEVQTFGRTSRLFAFQHFALDPFVDIVSIGKLSQVCATLYNKNYSPKPGLLSQTFIGSTSAIRSGKKIVETLLNDNFFGENGRNMQLHAVMVNHLKDISSRYPNLVKGPFGVGMMIAFTPFDGQNLLVNEFVHKLYEAGVISFVAGSDPTRVRFLIPFGNITETQIAQAMQIIEDTLIKINPS